MTQITEHALSAAAGLLTSVVMVASALPLCA
jgi:hypothetical protein